MNHINLVRSLAWEFTRKSTIRYDELFLEGCYAYSKALNNYNPKYGELPSYIYFIVKNSLIDFCKKESVYRSFCRNFSIGEEPYAREYRTFQEFYEELPSDVKELVDFILEHEEEIPDEKNKSIIENLLRINGWTWNKIWDTTSKLKKILKKS